MPLFDFLKKRRSRFDWGDDFELKTYTVDGAGGSLPIIFTFPQDYYYRIIGLYFILKTELTFGNRYLNVTAFRGSNPIWKAPTKLVIINFRVLTFSLSEGTIFETQTSADTGVNQINIPFRAYHLADDYISFDLNRAQPLDTFDPITITVQRWKDV